MTTPEKNTPDFYNLGIAPKLLSTLDAMGFRVPTPIQQQAIPVACSGKDLVGIAQTGTGKTIAFAVPMLQVIMSGQGRGLVLVPTRELAIQVNSVFEKFTACGGIRTAVLIGGEPIGRQKSALRRNPNVIVATPGRLLDHIAQHAIRLDTVKMLVLDEADRMLDMGFAPQIKRILQSVPKQRHTMLFSATMPETIMNIARAYMQLPVRVEVARQGTAAETVAQELFVVAKPDKFNLLCKLLDQYGGSVLLFARTKHNAKSIARAINNFGCSAAEIHSNRSLSQRKEALEGFKTGKYRVLVATDIAARGIDVTGIELVVNYDLPDDTENYVHRIGRTGRAGHPGHAISFAAPDQGADVRAIERLIRATLPISTNPDIPAHQLQRHPQQQPQHAGGKHFKPSRNNAARERGRRHADFAANRGNRHSQEKPPVKAGQPPAGRLEIRSIGGQRQVLGGGGHRQPPRKQHGRFQR
ncbi:MAG: DEAD/DEAH box helicase [Elusimicrobiales bacterium]